MPVLFTVESAFTPLPQSVPTVNGVPGTIEYRAEDFALPVDLPELPCNQEKVIKIIYRLGKWIYEIGTFSGASKRIARALEQLKYLRNSYIVFKEEFGKTGKSE